MKSVEETYKKFSQIEHVLNKPGMYIGSIDNISSKQLIYEKDNIIENTILYNPGLYKIIDELIVNAYDQSIRDKTLNEINVSINSDTFTIFNSGTGIPIEKHKDYNIYVPELIFGNLLTSSNYDTTEQRVTGGTHGIGSKASNIFSKKFIVEVWTNKKYYKQVFENNLSIINKPIIENNTTKKTGVQITCQPDFEKFNCKNFSDDMQKLIYRRVIDLTALVSNNIKIIINNKTYQNGFENYLSLYKSENNNKWFYASCVKNNLWYFAIRINDGELENNISFVNSIYTNIGGSHVEYIYDLLVPKFQKLINNNINKRFLKDNITLCLVTSIMNPVFNSQSKEQLSMPVEKFGFECSINNKFWDEIKDSVLINKLREIYSKQDLKQLTKFDGSKKSKIKGIPKLDDANLAGTKKSEQCVLILTEGDSAKATAIAGIGGYNHNKLVGRDIFGVYPLRGKLLNVREATTSQITNNQEILDIKKIMGFKTGVKYTKENLNELRYGSILLMMDADEDGSHIKGLIINFLNYFYPSLLEIDGFLKVLVTPVVKVFLKNETLKFSNLRQYNSWLNNNANQNFKTKYYKGLGTSTSNEAKEYFLELEQNTVSIIDKNNQNDILLAFAKDKVNERKNWLSKYNPDNILQIEPPTNINIGQFINQELIHFSNFDNIRSIPSLCDGFKPSQRKVLFACLKKNLKTEMKVAQLASYCAEVTAYHHGEQSLVQTIINMAQDFVGSNNLNLLLPIGQFGTRLTSKDYASGRYIFTQLNPLVEYIFKKEDEPLLDYLIDDDMNIEPKFYLPIIPMILINGAEGIGTGFSTFIPNYNIIDIIEWFENKLSNNKNEQNEKNEKNNKNNNKLEPYYNKFKGKIFKYDDTTYISEGICKIENNIVNISELPIKFWTTPYKEFLDELIEAKNSAFKSYSNFSTDTDVSFTLKIDNQEYINNLNNKIENNLNDLNKLLKLYKTIKLSNLTLYDSELKIKTYSSPEEICDEFYKWRLEWFEKRRLNMIENIKAQVDLISNQVKFIELVKSKPAIFNMEQTKLEEFLKSNKLKQIDNSYDYLINMTFKQLAKANLTKLTDKMNELNKQKKDLLSKTNKDLWLDDLIILKQKIKIY